MGYAIFFAGTLGVIAFVGPLFLLLSPFPRARIALLRTCFTSFLAAFTRGVLPVLGVYRFRELSGVPSPQKQAIYVANHRSRIEGPILLGILRNPGVIMKIDYARLPVFSFFVKHLDFISVDQHDLSQLSEARDRCRRTLQQGRGLLVFPEGTRSTSSRLHSFKDMAFRLAIEFDLPVVPIVVHTDVPFMARIPGSAIPQKRMELTVRFLDPIPAQKGERASDFAARTEKVFAEQLKALDKGTFWER